MTIGISVGVVALVCGLVVFSVLVFRRRRQRAHEAAAVASAWENVHAMTKNEKVKGKPTVPPNIAASPTMNPNVSDRRMSSLNLESSVREKSLQSSRNSVSYLDTNRSNAEQGETNNQEPQDDDEGSHREVSAWQARTVEMTVVRPVNRSSLALPLVHQKSSSTSPSLSPMPSSMSISDAGPMSPLSPGYQLMLSPQLPSSRPHATPPVISPLLVPTMRLPPQRRPPPLPAAQVQLRKQHINQEVKQTEFSTTEEWIKVFDDNTKKFYYYHSVTLQTRWDNPNKEGE